MSEKIPSRVILPLFSSQKTVSAIVRAGTVVVVCCCLLFPGTLFARAVKAESPRPGGQAPGIAADSPGSQPSGSPSLAPFDGSPKAHAAKPSGTAPPRTNGKKSVGKQGSNGEIKGFSQNPFGLNHRTASPTTKRVRIGKNGVPVQGTTSNSTQNSPDKNSRIVFSGGGQDEKKDDRLSPRRSAFSGGPDTLPRMDEETPPEVSLTYKMNERTSTRFSVNQQDETSPLYRPAKKENGVNSAGIYMDVDVQDNLQLRIGGEYHEVDQNRYDQDESSQGASIGLRWNF